MSDDLIDRLTAAFMGHADNVDRNLFGRARDALQAQAAEIDEYEREMAALLSERDVFKRRAEAAEAKLREAVEVLYPIGDLTGGVSLAQLTREEMDYVHRARAFLATMEKTDGK